MESVAARLEAPWGRMVRTVDTHALSTWTLVGTIVLYLAIDGGGYDLIVHSQVGLVAWWIVLIAAAWGLVTYRRVSRAAWAAVGLLGAFVAWTAIATTWSLSTERSLADLSLVACYLGIFVLAVAIYRDREQAIRHTVNALAAAVVLIACLALASRLHPGLFASAQQTSSFLPGTKQRLGWPLNYWNGLGALLAVGVPLLLTVATTARTLYAQTAAAAGVPIVALSGYLTFSRGSALAAVVALVVFIALVPERIPKLATLLATGVGSFALIVGAVHRAAVEQGFTDAAARHQGASLIGAVVLVCIGVGLSQVGIGLAIRHATPPRWLSVPVRRARALLAGAVVLLVTAALVAGGPGALSHAWRNFKNPTAPGLTNLSLERYGTLSGNGRYDYWKVAVKATGGHVLGGSGPGTYQLLWLPRAPYLSYIQNAHSLYFETLSEVGIVGLGLLLGLFGLVLWTAVELVRRSRYESRTRAAGVAAAVAAFLVSAGTDWIWQMPVLPACFLLLAAALFAPRPGADRQDVIRRPTDDQSPRRRVNDIVLRVGTVGVAIACVVAIAIPLATNTAIRRSQAAVQSGSLGVALTDARAAVGLEPGSATAQDQLALVLEAGGDIRGALGPAMRAVQDEPQNWSTWLLVSRLQAELGHPTKSLSAFRRAESLNPRSPVFTE